MIGGLRNFTAKEDREAGTELRLVAPTTLARCRRGCGSITGFSFNLLHRVCVPVYHAQTCGAFRPLKITETLRTWRYVVHETYESPQESKDD